MAYTPFFWAMQAAGSPELGTPLVCGHGVVALGIVTLIGRPEQFVPVGVVADLVVTDVAEVKDPAAERPGLLKVTAPATAQPIFGSERANELEPPRVAVAMVAVDPEMSVMKFPVVFGPLSPVRHASKVKLLTGVVPLIACPVARNPAAVPHEPPGST